MSSEGLQPLMPVTALDRHDPPIVTIEPEKLDALTLCAYERAKNSPGSIENHELGIHGEYAFAKYRGIPEAVDTEIYEYGDDGYDLEIDGQTVDVKTVNQHANNPELWVNVDCQLNADHYVLVHKLNASKFQIIGYAPRELVRNARVRKIRCDGYCDRVRAVPRDMLFPI
jgi:hypothetical protein